MENATKALEMAAGVLLGLLIMAAIAYFFTRVSVWPQQEEKKQTVEQLAKFNLEYEVFDKKGMYGTDVISCLTKAQSNNQKYVEGGKYLTGTKYGEDFLIDVYVKINSDLEEELTVYRFDNTKRTMVMGKIEIPDNRKGEISEDDFTMSDAKFIFGSNQKGEAYTKFKKNTVLQTVSNELSKGTLEVDVIDISKKIDAGTGIMYNAELVDKSNPTVKTPLQKLLEFSNVNMKQIVKNTTGKNLDIWSDAEWKTALYDFKTRRFRCDKIEYSEITGRVNKICFSEL